MICRLAAPCYKLLEDDEKMDEMCGECSTHGTGEVHPNLWCENPKESENSQDLGANVRAIF